jgi:two-component system NtrC family sensor kinase
VSIVKEITPDLPTLPVRQTELEQVFLNLIANARDALAAAGPAGMLHIRAGIDAQSVSRLLRIEVADTGIGIPAENRARVLEPFFTTKPAGNGLGLSICRSIVWQCQGRIHLECPSGLATEPGRPGTRVVITAPAGKAV